MAEVHGALGAEWHAFGALESRVRNYSRAFPAVFRSASGAEIRDEHGKSYVDFFAGAGALNYGHNDPVLKEALLCHLRDDGVVHSLDMATTAKRAFIEEFHRTVLAPRDLDYRLQFTGPTGAHAVEAALRVARKATGRSGVIAFTNGFHGMSHGALAVTGQRSYQRFPGNSRQHVTFMPFDGYHGPACDTLALVERYLDDPSSGVDRPAAFIVEAVQAEGGVRTASSRWLRGLEALARKVGSLLIVDDIQAGCGRTGRFFSFEESGVRPDIVTLSKSLSGYGLPLAVVLLRPEVDVWEPGEHSGTFRGNNLAFVTAHAALRRYWSDGALTAAVEEKGEALRAGLLRARLLLPDNGDTPEPVRGRGLLLGLDTGRTGLARAVAAAAFRRGLVVETCGSRDEVVKCLPPLTIEPALLDVGIDLLEQAVRDVVTGTTPRWATTGMAASAS
ncbi:diaminobutyrate--2-oxoglutarate transaminase [Umezawaea sp.]|uniref:diaminobutyrate--2-oxoglutarate transaminase n=1 Tax=Umezawaea sp. TaxID=1955258 RepID=UPI002ED47DF1